MDDLVERKCSAPTSPWNPEVIKDCLSKGQIGTPLPVSRHSKSLHEIISDKNCLTFFVQFLESRSDIHSLKFYLETESIIMSGKSLNMQSFKHSNGNVSKFSSELSAPSECSRSSSLTRFKSVHYKACEINNRLSKSLEYILFDINVSNPYKTKKKVGSIKSDFNKVSPGRDACSSPLETLIYNNEQNSWPGTIDTFALNKIYASDAFRIYKRYLTKNSPGLVSIPPTIIANILSAFSVSERCDDNYSTKLLNYLSEAQNYVLRKLEKKYLNDFLESSFYYRYCLNILTSSNFSIKDVLFGEHTLFYFMEYLEQLSKSSLLEFWMAATNFQTHYESRRDNFSKSEAQSDAMVLYDKYFSLQAPCSLEVTDCVRSCIEERICADNNSVIYCFDLPLRIIETYFDKCHFKSFTSSSLFCNYLIDLKTKSVENKINVFPINKSNDRKCKPRLTNKITLNVPKDVNMEKNSLHTKRSRAAISSNKNNELINTNFSWHTNNSPVSCLTFGRVDYLGRYERNFEALSEEKEKWSISVSGNRFKNAVKKLAKLPEAHKEEEFAWQAAEMIIKDVTNITLSNMPSSSVERLPHAGIRDTN